MDLRAFPMPPDIAEVLRRQIEIDRVSWYQPFVFTDTVMTGVGAIWNAGGQDYLCTGSEPANVVEDFARETATLSDWYARVADILVAAFPDAQSYLDIGCNMGLFGIDLVQRGRSYTGVDVPRNAPGVRLLQSITGTDFEFLALPYDENEHRIRGLDDGRMFDVGILSFVIVHLTDPHYAMPYFAAKLRRGCFFATNLVPQPGHAFHARIRHHDRARRLPHTFELVPTEAMAESLLRFSGFPYAYRIPYREGVDPRNLRGSGCWIAAREPIPDEAIDRFALVSVEDRSGTFTEGPVPGWRDVPADGEGADRGS
jgi:SAM-dependent methyltransferase